MEALATAHQLLGYAVGALLLAAAIVAFVFARDPNRPFAAGPYVAAAIAVDVQVLGGLAIYTIGAYWDHPSPLVRFIHPLLAIATLLVAHLTVARARRGDAATASHRTAGGGLLATLLLAAGAIATVSAGLRGAGT